MSVVISPMAHCGIVATIDDYMVEIIGGKSTVVYTIHCRSERSLLEWEVPRRFSEFRENFMLLYDKYPISPITDFQFPRRTILQLASHFQAESRRQMLQQYLEKILQITPPPLEVAAFLRITKERYAKKRLTAETGDTRERSDKFGECFLPVLPQSPVDGDGSEHRKYTSEDELDQNSSVLSSSENNKPLPPQQQRSKSTKILEEDLKDDDDDNEHHHQPLGIQADMLVRILLVSAAACIVKFAFMFLHQILDGGDLTLIGLLKNLTDTVIRHKQDVFLVVKTIIFVSVCSIYFHRVLGFVIGVYLRSLLSTPKGGFLMYFDWIALRIGYDHNEIVVHGFEWRNPPKYQVERSRYFLYVRKLSLQFDLRSLVDAILQREDRFGNKSPLRVWALEIDGLDVRIERGRRKKDGLNLWASLGADNEKKADEVQAGVKAGLAKAAKDVGEGLAIAGQAMEEGLHKAGGAVVGGVKAVGKGILKYNPVSVLARAMSDRPGESSGAGAEGNLVKADDIHDDRRETTAMVEDDCFHEIDPEELQRKGEAETWHEGGEGVPAVDLTKSQKNRSNLFRRSAVEPPPPPKSSAWGVPFRIETDRFTGRNLEFHVQDCTSPFKKIFPYTVLDQFSPPDNNSEKNLIKLSSTCTPHHPSDLNASHVEDRPIIIPLMDMDRRELTTRGKRTLKNPSGYRQPVWLDDLTWKIVNRLIADLLKTNSLSLMATVAASGANNAVTGLVEGSHIATVGAAEGLYSYNPKDILAGMGRGLTRLANKTKVSGGGLGENQPAATIFKTNYPPLDTSLPRPYNAPHRSRPST